MKYILILIKGGIIGIANIIPGVSGGTLALILGIYKRLIEAIKNIDISTIKVGLTWLKSPKKNWSLLKAELARIDFVFLVCIGVGALGAIFAASHAMEIFLKGHHAAAYSFFFGLILLSIYFPYQYLKRKSFIEWLSLILAVGFIVAIDVVVPNQQRVEKAQKSLERDQMKQDREKAEKAGTVVDEQAAEDDRDYARLALLFFAGALCISAMILPGISGSFVLLLMGVYFDILIALNNHDYLTLGVVAAGMGVGLLVFVRLINWFLKKFYDATIAFMIGLMAGSLWSLWPFKATTEVSTADLTETVYLNNILPSAGTELASSLVAFIIGAVIIAVFIVVDKKMGGEKSLV